EAAKGGWSDAAVRPVNARDQADARGKPPDPVRFEGPHLRAEMGRDPGPRGRARRPAVSEPPPVVRRVALSGPRGPHAETGDPGRGDRRHERSAAELREIATAGAGERQDRKSTRLNSSHGSI